MPKSARLLLALTVAALAASSPAAAAQEPAAERLRERSSGQGAALARAKEESGRGAKLPPRGDFEAAGVAVAIAPNEIVAGTRATVRIVAGGRTTGRLRVTVPELFTRRSSSGLRFAEPARAFNGARLARAGRVLRLELASGRSPGIAIEDNGLPAGTYELGLAHEAPGGEVTRLGTAQLRVYAPSRESEAEEARRRAPWPLRPSRLATDTTRDFQEQSETFVTVSPADPNRITVGYNNTDDIRRGPTVTADGGRTFKTLTQPNLFDVRGQATAERNSVSGDPMSAADPLGNVWYGGLSVDEDDAGTTFGPSRIYVNRIDPQTQEFQPRSVGLDFVGRGQQDKNMMTIDNSPESPTFGRLYVVWNDLPADPDAEGKLQVIAFCDTRLGGTPAVARCDDADNWSRPVPVVQQPGSYIYADVAVAPTGDVYFTYWDFSAVNSIRGAVCRAAGTGRCGTPGSFAPPVTVATLNAFGGRPLPFACPIFSAPGGRVGPSPGVEVDTSGGRERGRVWVSWGDLRDGSGTTRCEQLETGNGTPPQSTQLTWDAFAASAGGGLPGPATPGATRSGDVGTKVSPDAGTTPAPSSPDNTDDFFPWLAVDRSTGRAFIDYYTTAGDSSRRTTDFIVAPLAPGTGTKPEVGERVKVNDVRSNYAEGSPAGCCMFSNDYGDYTGLDAAQGKVVPVWSSRAGGVSDDGDALISILDFPAPPEPEPSPTPTPTPAPTAPPASPSPTPAPVAPAPTVRLPRFLAFVAVDRAKASTVRRRGLRVRLRCNRACRVTSQFRVDRRTAGRLGLRSLVLGTRRASRTRAGRTTFTIRLTRPARRALARRGARSVSYMLRSSFSDANGGNRRTSVRRFRLR